MKKKVVATRMTAAAETRISVVEFEPVRCSVRDGGGAILAAGSEDFTPGRPAVCGGVVRTKLNGAMFGGVLRGRTSLGGIGGALSGGILSGGAAAVGALWG
ncbi:MAG: hypothetical protein WAN29_06870, partial [Candidatus Sulfotelmatobacter sp.]